MVSSFKQYLVEEQKEVFFTFGRMNPPTVGHGKLMNVMAVKAGKMPYKIYLSQSYDPAKNPLNYKQKIKHVRKMFSKHARNVILNTKVINVFQAASSLYDQGYNRITMVVGSDRVVEFETLLKKYNGTKGKHGFYNFENINVVSAGERDPDAEGVTGMSASKQRENAKNNDFTTFSQGVPSTMSSKDAKRLFNDVRIGMGLKETIQFKNHIDFGPHSDLREKYIEGDLFNEGERVVIKSTQQAGYVHRLGTNYVIVALDEGRISRQWFTNLVKEEKQPEWGTTASTKKAKRVTPGEKMKEQAERPDEIEKTKKLIDNEKMRDQRKYDRLLDRARLIHARKKNAATNVSMMNKKQ
jgi:nicotinamide mononucleotide adenylyltransferase